MNQYRIKTDIIDIEWQIFRNIDIPENFDGDDIIKDSIVFEIVHSTRNVRYRQNFVYRDGNKVRLYFMAKEQQLPGVYDLYLKYEVIDYSVEGGIRTYIVDYPSAFELVDRSYRIAVPPEYTVYRGVVEQLKGYSAYEIYLKNTTDDPPMTEDEWLESLRLHFYDLTDDEIAVLQQPAMDTIDEVLAAKAAIEENELARQANEQQRIANEQAREQNEQTRQANESVRVLSENERITSEAERVNNENLRITEEAERQNNEITRQAAETERISNEQIRQDNEDIRETNEIAREQLKDELITLKEETETAKLDAIDATENANTAATNADDARLAIQDDLALKVESIIYSQTEYNEI
jgi:hypothetical protein